MLSLKSDCADGPNGEIGEWDASKVTDMSGIFSMTDSDGAIWKWDLSHVTDMTNMFLYAKLFDHDLLTWDGGLVRSHHTHYNQF